MERRESIAIFHRKPHPVEIMGVAGHAPRRRRRACGPVGHPRETSGDSGEIRRHVCRQRHGLRPHVGPLQGGFSARLRRLRRRLRLRKGGSSRHRSLCEGIEDRPCQSNSPLRRVDNSHGPADRQGRHAPNRHGIHHPRHQHRPQHLRQRQTALRLP